MKADISALMDGELPAGEFDAALAALRQEGEALAAWRTYHLIGDALQGRGALPGGASAARIMARLASEPVLVGRLPADIAVPQRTRWFVPSAMAASLAAIALVGWMALAPRPSDAPVAQVASAPAATPVAAAKATVVRQPLTAAARDYLIAHQAYSPRHSLQGVAPYVRSVSADSGPAQP